jgi:hypothetical protein
VDRVVIRFYDSDRLVIVKQTGKDWSQVVALRAEDVFRLAQLFSDMEARGMNVFVYVNNHLSLNSLTLPCLGIIFFLRIQDLLEQ